MRIVKLKLLNLSLISALFFAVSPNISGSKSSIRKKINNSQFSTGKECNNNDVKKEDASSNLEGLIVETFLANFYRQAISNPVSFHKDYRRIYNFFKSGLSPPLA